MSISPEDIATLEKLTGEQGARGALSRVMLAIIGEQSQPDTDTEVLEAGE